MRLQSAAATLHLSSPMVTRKRVLMRSARADGYNVSVRSGGFVLLEAVSSPTCRILRPAYIKSQRRRAIVEPRRGGAKSGMKLRQLEPDGRKVRYKSDWLDELCVDWRSHVAS
jgi:hypothetical protein